VIELVLTRPGSCGRTILELLNQLITQLNLWWYNDLWTKISL